MKKLILIFFALLSISMFAQKKDRFVPIKAENWEFKPETVKFLEYKSRPALKILTSSDRVILKDLNFIDGTIEYDFEPLDPAFISIYFRWKDALENECFYFRTGAAGNPFALDAIQYAPHVNGINLWDMLFHYKSNSDFKTGDWNHVKIVISDQQMLVFVNVMGNPDLVVERLEGDTKEGLIAFDGQAIISNLQIKPNETEGLSPEPGSDPTINDSRYLRKWQVSEPILSPGMLDFDFDYLPKETTKWTDNVSERRGLMNVARQFGKTDGRRIVWMKTTINSAKDQKRLLSLGFSDEVWVFVNKQPLHVDKNCYGTPLVKSPNGRLSIENTSFDVPLKEGGNELLIGIANRFYGWGIAARLDKLTDLKINNNLNRFPPSRE